MYVGSYQPARKDLSEVVEPAEDERVWPVMIAIDGCTLLYHLGASPQLCDAVVVGEDRPQVDHLIQAFKKWAHLTDRLGREHSAVLHASLRGHWMEETMPEAPCRLTDFALWYRARQTEESGTPLVVDTDEHDAVRTVVGDYQSLTDLLTRMGERGKPVVLRKPTADDESLPWMPQGELPAYFHLDD